MVQRSWIGIGGRAHGQDAMPSQDCSRSGSVVAAEPHCDHDGASSSRVGDAPQMHRALASRRGQGGTAPAAVERSQASFAGSVATSAATEADGGRAGLQHYAGRISKSGRARYTEQNGQARFFCS